MFRNLVSTFVLMSAGATPAFAATPCAGLASLRLQNATVTSATDVAKGPYLPSGLPADAAANPRIQIPAYCRVALLLTPTADSHIEVESWMPRARELERKVSGRRRRWLGRESQRQRDAQRRLVPGGEADWPISAFAGAPDPGAIDLGIFRYVAHEDPGWDWHTFDLERDTALALEKGGYVEVTDPDLSAFKSRGGKLLMYHGWNDGGSGGAISPLNSVNYYSSVLAKMGPRQDDWLRLFMVPGMDHCGGGPGPNQFAALTALANWRERGEAPDHITATRSRSTAEWTPRP